MLFKIAFGNVRRASKDYLVYLLTLTLAVTVFYAFNTVSMQVDIAGVGECNEGIGEMLGSTIFGLTAFLAVVMGFLMVYANNFIMKRRKKEFGLYQVLGMSRGQVARIMALETLFVSLAALMFGLVLGIGLSQLMVFFTASLFKTQIADFHFFVSADAALLTVVCLAVIFLVTLVFNLRVVARARIVDLMSAGRRNETIKTRNPWVSAAVFVVGLAAIIVAYVRLLHDGLPYDGAPEAMNAFGITTAIVVVGTVLFFFGLSGFLLKALQGVRSLYWRGLNMVTLRQLSAKVNTVSFSMAVISMILFLAITSVTTGMSIASTMNESVERGTPFDYTRVLVYYSQGTVDDWNADSEINGGVRHFARAKKPVDLMEMSGRDMVTPASDEGGAAAEHPYELAETAERSLQVDVYDSVPVGASEPLVGLGDLCRMTGSELPKGTETSNSNTMGLAIMKESDYNAYLRFRGLEEVELGENGYTITSDMGESITPIYDKTLAQGIELKIGDRVLHPVQDKVNRDASSFENAMMGMNAGTLIVPDDLVDSLGLAPYTSYLMVDFPDSMTDEQVDEFVSEYRYYADITDEDGDIVGSWGVEASRAETYQGVNTMTGLISYLAIYIGFVLVVACAAILTIQQLSGVADAGKNYRILSELGTSRREIMRSVLVQQATFFVFPLIVGIAHAVCALKVIIELVALFGGMSIGGTVGLTAAIFVVAYGGYFLVTYLMSKGIVNDAVRVRYTA